MTRLILRGAEGVARRFRIDGAHGMPGAPRSAVVLTGAAPRESRHDDDLVDGDSSAEDDGVASE